MHKCRRCCAAQQRRRSANRAYGDFLGCGIFSKDKTCDYLTRRKNTNTPATCLSCHNSRSSITTRVPSVPQGLANHHLAAHTSHVGPNTSHVGPHVSHVSPGQSQ